MDILYIDISCFENWKIKHVTSFWCTWWFSKIYAISTSMFETHVTKFDDWQVIYFFWWRVDILLTNMSYIECLKILRASFFVSPVFGRHQNLCFSMHNWRLTLRIWTNTVTKNENKAISSTKRTTSSKTKTIIKRIPSQEFKCCIQLFLKNTHPGWALIDIQSQSALLQRFLLFQRCSELYQPNLILTSLVITDSVMNISEHLWFSAEHYWPAANQQRP